MLVVVVVVVVVFIVAVVRSMLVGLGLLGAFGRKPALSRVFVILSSNLFSRSSDESASLFKIPCRSFLTSFPCVKILNS